MKKIYLMTALLAVVLAACETKEIEVFNSRSQVCFEKFFMNAVYPGTEQADSTVVSFFFYPDGTQDIEAELAVLYSGLPLTADRAFQLKVVEQMTTATPDEYTLDPAYVFHAQGTVDSVRRDIRDIIKIKLHRSERFDQGKAAVLCVEIVPNEELAWGQVERVRARIYITAQAAQPAWWTKEVTNNLLGNYSQTKYKYFLNEVDKKAQMSEELIKEHPDQAIRLVMEFKEWLMKQNPAVEDEYGVISVVL